MKVITLLFSFLVLAQLCLAQDIIVSGKVTDSNGNAISGVLVQSSIASDTTDESGSFSVGVTDNYQTLTLSGKGFVTKTISVGGKSTIDVNLFPQSTESSQLITGFGTQTRESSGSSISQIDGKALSNQPVVSVEQTSQGRAAGVFIQNSGGKLGDGAKVRIRGGSSLSGSNDPLYVVDGVPLTSNNQSNIDPSLIESMEILKDAAATSLYGSRAANGVVIITTKKGKQGKLKVDLDYQFGVSTLAKRLDMMSPGQYRILNFEYTLRALIAGLPIPDVSGNPAALENVITRKNLELWFSEMQAARQSAIDANQSTLTYSFPNNDQITINVNHPLFRFQYDTDWQDLAFRTALSHRASVNLSGGSKRHQVFTNINYLDQEGILIGNNYERFGGRVNVSSQLTNRLTSNLSFNYAKTNNNKLNEDADIGNPVQMVLLPSADEPDPANNYVLKVRSSEYNPQTEIYRSLNFQTRDQITGNLGLKLDLTNQLSLNMEGGVDYLDFREERRQGPATQEGSPTGLSRLGTTNLFNYLINGYFNYSLPIGENILDIVLGGSYQKSNSVFTFRRARVNSISQLEQLTENDPSLLENPIPGSAFSFLSSYTRINYSIRSKYHFQLSARIDGSSKFGSANPYGIFPAASAAWNLSSESFLQNNTTVSFLKLKASYGLVGNTPEDDFLYRNNYFSVLYGDLEGIRLSNLGNKQLKWETTAQLDVGVEFGLFNERLFGSVNYYQKNTSDLLFPVPVSQTSGFSSVVKNVGTMVNQGVEFALSSVNFTKGPFEWTSDFNIATNRNTVKDLGDQRLIAGVNAFTEGEPAGVFYMVKYRGVDPLTGAAQYENAAGFASNDYNAALDNARQVVGNPNPKFYGGLSNNLSYGNITLNFTFQFVQGIDLYWETGELIANSGYALYNQTSDQLDRWYQVGDQAANPVVSASINNTNPSSRWLVDGSYIRLNNLTLNYDLTNKFTGFKLSTFSIYVGAQNLFTITDYPGYDPDVSYSDPAGGTFARNINRGIDLFTAPQPRVFITGLKVGF